jgi:hypothetical protein
MLMAWLTWGTENPLGTFTFVILWLMRWSAKLNLFLGVPNLNEEWLPERIRFLTTYLAKRPMNLLFPVSVSVATVIMCLLVDTALELTPGGFAGVALMLAATLLALAILEHWLLVLPLADGALWRWALTSSQPSTGASQPVQSQGQTRGSGAAAVLAGNPRRAGAQPPSTRPRAVTVGPVGKHAATTAGDADHAQRVSVCRQQLLAVRPSR